MENFELVLATLLLWLVLPVIGWWVAPRRGYHAGPGALFMAWLFLAALTLWSGIVITFIAVSALLFTLGQGIAWFGLMACLACLVASPFVCAIVVWRRAHRAPAGS